MHTRPTTPQGRHDREALLHQVRTLLGRRCRLRGASWRLIDLLPGEELLILESDDEHAAEIQADQYGRPRQRRNTLLQVPLFDRHRCPSAPLRELLDTLTPTLARRH
ncbi:hypothetical protein MARPU_04080 [Marichromatium purpuratum 984]|uniref:Uncharacterized protein n=2 Tax=Marichromatium TaxID=85076 RepID=W0E3P4_MARPU|nr:MULTISPECIES: hypothetical protein [Marichromatium]MBO8087303.1 hypothetical protein [Marichromatium sp.]AHF05372.1 hypothetical protein MARPU_04080 [Marichromatium purpuratum 984]MBK1708698.1 hypothetical protein [Marichromatium gracile]RNE91058.1 hypothetical protein EBL84_05385 [Marichromatium sp. AB31]RNE93735.1 hypothetical protein EBL85_05740 [Marichromatium sp. AB32]